jgi:hypothetical protein
MKKLLFTLTFFIITSCSSNKQIEVMQSSTHNAGILVVKFGDVEAVQGSLLKYFKFSTSIFEICNIHKEDDCLDLKNYFTTQPYDNGSGGDRGQKTLDINPDYYVFLIPEGEYYLKNITNESHTTNMKGKYINQKPTFAKFIIKKDEINYIGDMEKIFIKQKTRFNIYKGIFELCIKNNIENARKYLEVSMPMLDAKKLKYQELELGTDAVMKCL